MMNRCDCQINKPGAAWIAGLWLVLGLAACNPFWSAPESRARDFIEALVTSPAEIQPLRDIANLPPEQNPDALISDLSARVGLDFLRARQAQGVSLKFVAGEARPVDDAHRAVVIHVAYLQPGTPVAGEVRFLVRLEKDAQARWRIARVTGDN
ncbi:hypothetical protein SCL_0037 [Sulfuricaulis limicola]|uniref:Lipoprotein n=1 Tax=Sulfuricaulis limicola TaxID=1620215 RepID=A0A1B4XC45_9GAMM|nr:hypothetical protein [Sulfuricaulis limicola]BAV32362.1 hypothetical protein SCL_0037 [Sulfuricaulis limicola]